MLLSQDLRYGKPTKKEEVFERHRHRYEFNNAYREAIEKAGLKVVGSSPNGELVEIVEPGRSSLVCGGSISP